MILLFLLCTTQPRMHLSERMCKPSTPSIPNRLHPSAPIPSASGYFLDLSCQLMSCQTCSDLSCDYAGKVRKKEGASQVLLLLLLLPSFCRLVWSVHRQGEGVAEARRARATGRGRCVNELHPKMRKKVICTCKDGGKYEGREAAPESFTHGRCSFLCRFLEQSALLAWKQRAHSDPL